MADSILIKKRYKAQAVLETSITFILAVIFILGIIRIGVWANVQLSGRQKSFNDTRVIAGTIETEAADARVNDKEELKGKINNLQDRLKEAINSRRDSVSAEDAAALDAMSDDLDSLVTNYIDSDTYVPSGYVQDTADNIAAIPENTDLSGIGPADIESLSSNREVSPELKDNLTAIQEDMGEFTDSYNSYVDNANADLEQAGDNTNAALDRIDEAISSAGTETGGSGESGGGPESIQGIIKELKSAISDYSQLRDDIQRQHGQLIWPVYRPKPLSEEWAIPKSPFKK